MTKRIKLTVSALPALTVGMSRKVSPYMVPKSAKVGDFDTLRNCFNLSPDDTCTPTAECFAKCYVRKGVQWPSMINAWNHNLTTLVDTYNAGGTDTVVALLVDVIDRSVSEQIKRGIERPLFRVHESGDLFARWYANAWRKAAAARPDVTVWLYTRRFEFVGALLSDGPPNLSVYLSVDVDNVQRAIRVFRKWEDHGVRVATMGETEQIGRDLLRKVTGRIGPTCPTTNPRRKADSWSETDRTNRNGRKVWVGACSKCRLCANGTNHVVFVEH